MSERTSQRLVDDERAEFSVSALMFLSVVLVSTSILSTFLLSIAERTMVDGRETAQSQSDVVNGIISVTYIELSALNGPGGGDQLHMGFEFPYLVGNLDETAVRWVLTCSDGNTGRNERLRSRPAPSKAQRPSRTTASRPPPWTTLIQAESITCS